MVRCLTRRAVKFFSCAALLSALLPPFAPASASPETYSVLRLTTLEWPPHIFADGSGPLAEVVRKAFRQVGSDVVIEVHPWHRAVSLAAENQDYAGVFPEYYSVEADAEADGNRCLFSQPFARSPLGLAEHRRKPLTWTEIGDLADLRIGTVRGYKNGDMFDLMAATRRIHAVETTSDEKTCAIS